MKNPLNNTGEAAENIQRSPQFYRTRKALLFLPLLVIPLLTLGFWNFHHTPAGQLAAQSENQRLNTSLPGAKFDKHVKAGDKMSFYNQAQADSAKQQSANNNPLLQKMGFKTNENKGAVTHQSSLTMAYPDPNVVKINQRLADINREISQPQKAAVPQAGTINPAPDKNFNQQVTKLEMLMKSMNNGQGNDPQMQQLSKMLQQIQDIQHPELAKPVVKAPPANTDSLFKAIPASIEGNQKVLQGGIVKLRLNDTIRIKGKLFPKGQLLFGNANITNQRLLLDIKNIRIGNAIIPVNLSVYSLDGLPGINAPDAELVGAAGDGANNAIESMQFLSMDQSLATQAATGGINAAKGLFSKKVRRIKVKLKNDYPVLLRNNNLK
jgi:hypothetical protein